MSIPLQIAEPTTRCRRDLRRFTFRGKAVTPCNNEWGHDATNTLGEISLDDANRTHGDNWPHDDWNWPSVCERCGYKFRPEDEWQRNDNPLYRLPDGTEFTLWGGAVEGPPGAMVRATWFDEFSDHPDGIESWLIVLPDKGTWITSQKASGGGYWTVTGIAPNITASPSVFHNAPTGWHGWVRNGELVDA